MHFFLTSNSPRGFYSKMDLLGKNLPYDWNSYIIKGCSGCGKSTMMKKIASKIHTQTEFIHCSFDPESLDAIVFPKLKLCILDGTNPHVIDPNFPGISNNIINLCELKEQNYDQKLKFKLFNLNRQYKSLYQQSQKYLIAFGAIFGDSIESSIKDINFDNINYISKRISKKLFKNFLHKKPTRLFRMIRSIGPEGIYSFYENFLQYDKIYEINDDHFIISDILLKYIENNAYKYGYDTISCLSPFTLNERIEALIIPEINTCFFVSNELQKNSSEFKTKKINIEDFYYELPTKNLYNSRMIKSLINESIKSMKKAKKFHHEIEKIYKKLIDFKSVDNKTDHLIKEIKNKYPILGI